MLVLGRKEGERVVIVCPGGERVVVTVVDLMPHRMRLGFDAPDTVKIYRSEVLHLLEQSPKQDDRP